MANVVEFILQMKDMMSGGMQSAAATAKRAMETVKTAVDKVPPAVHKITDDVRKMSNAVTGSNRGIITSYSELERRLTSVKQKMNDATDPRRIQTYQRYLQNLNRDMASHPVGGQSGKGSSGGGILSTLGGGLGRAAGILGIGLSAGAALGFAKDAVGSAMNYGATEKSFSVLTGNAAKGTALAGTLNKLQQDTILGPEVFKSAQTLMGFGVAADRVVKIERQLGDVSMGNKDHFDALTLAFSQTQAAGKLMGQDLLQYINAGFNPLQVMSERWKDFGLKQKTSVGQLKEMMEQGKVSSEAVAKAFELATSSGGKFNGMMDQIATTSYGKMQVLEGQWENFKIGLGKALIPVANDLMTAANKALDFLDINKTAPQVLANERAEINTLVTSITSLNEKNDLRHRLLQNLIAKYPEFFGKLDAEKVANNELLKSLDAVNAAYEKKYNLASSQFALDNNTKSLNENQSEYQRNTLILNALKHNNMEYAKSLMKFTEGDMLGFGDVRGRLINKFQAQALYYEGRLKTDQDQNKSLVSANNFAKATNAAPSLFSLAQNASIKTFGGNKEQWKDFKNTWGKIRPLGKGQFKGATADILHLQDLLSSATAGGREDLFKPGKDKGGRLSSGITSGGPRTINIYINKEMIGKLSINSYNVREGVGEMENMIEEGVKRVLYSAAQAT